MVASAKTSPSRFIKPKMDPQKPSITAVHKTPKNPQSTICAKAVEKAFFSRSAPIILLITTVPPVETTVKTIELKFKIVFVLPTAATEFSLYPLSTAELIMAISLVATVSSKSGKASEKTFKLPSEVETV